MRQLVLPPEISPAELTRKQTFGQVITLTYESAGYTPKEAAAACRFDKGQLSRWEAGTEGITWPKLEVLMNECNNDAPVLWQFHRRGFDLASARKRESELELELRLVTEERDALRRVVQAGGR